MPFRHGKNTQVLLDGVDLSAYLKATEFGIDVDIADSTTYTAPWKTALAGQAGGKVDFEGNYDPAELTIRNSLGVDGSILSYFPGGAPAIGDLARMLVVASSGYAEGDPVGGIVGIKWGVASEAPVGMGQMLHPLAEDTNTTTGADKDDGATGTPSTTGWLAHLHVTAVDAGGGSWVIKLQDALTTDWVDVAGGAFPAMTAIGGRRLISAAGATLRRHVRYIATRTGGSAGDGITFALAYSRNS